MRRTREEEEEEKCQGPHGSQPLCAEQSDTGKEHQQESGSRSGGSNTGSQRDATRTTAHVPLKINSKDIAGGGKKTKKTKQ